MGYFRRSPPFPCVPGGRVETAFVPRGLGGSLQPWLNFEDFLLKLGECGRARMGEEQGALPGPLHFTLCLLGHLGCVHATND